MAPTFSKWQGQCSECQAWNSLVEETVPVVQTGKTQRSQLSKQQLGQKLVNFSQVDQLSSAKQRFFDQYWRVGSGVGRVV